MPFIYYGDELGMVDGIIPPEEIQDPFEQKSPGLKLGRDPQRTPMQWSDEQGAGFSVGESWLPVAQDFIDFNYKTESTYPHSFLALYKKLIRLRREIPALREGSCASQVTQNEKVFAYQRKHDQTTILIILNYSRKSQAVQLGFKHGKILIDSLDVENTKQIELESFQLLANQGLVIELHT